MGGVDVHLSWRSMVSWTAAVLLCIVSLGALAWMATLLWHHPWGLVFLILVPVGLCKGLSESVTWREAAPQRRICLVDWVSKNFDRVFAFCFGALVWILVALVPIVVARYAADLISGGSVAVGLVVLVFWSVLLYLALFPAWREDRRRTVLFMLRQAGRAAPAVYGVFLLSIAVIFFGSLAWFLAEHGWASFGEGPEPQVVQEPIQAADLFLWQTLDAVPALKVNDTLRWRPPLTYRDGRIGALVLAFKVTVLLPVLAMLSTSWRSRGQPSVVDAPARLLPDWLPRWPPNKAELNALDSLQCARNRINVANDRLMLARSDFDVSASRQEVAERVKELNEVIAGFAFLVKDDDEVVRRIGLNRCLIRAAKLAVDPEIAAGVASRFARPTPIMLRLRLVREHASRFFRNWSKNTPSGSR